MKSRARVRLKQQFYVLVNETIRDFSRTLNARDRNLSEKRSSCLNQTFLNFKDFETEKSLLKALMNI